MRKWTLYADLSLRKELDITLNELLAEKKSLKKMLWSILNKT